MVLIVKNNFLQSAEHIKNLNIIFNCKTMMLKYKKSQI